MANIKACFTITPFQTKIPSLCRLRRRQRRFYPAYHIYLRDHHPFDYKPDTIPETNRIRYYAYSGWLSRQFRQQEGVSLEPYSFRIVSYHRVPVVRKFGTPPILGPDVTCRGNFIVENPERFEQLITQGIGRHRAYGYGMIMLRQLHDVRTPPGGIPNEPEFGDEEDC